MPHVCSFSRLSLAVLLLALLGSVAWAKPKVAILGLEAINSGVVDPKDAQHARDMTEALRKIPRGGVGKYDFAPNSNRELQDEKLMGNCDNEAAGCMAPIGAALSAEFLVFGRSEKVVEKGKDGYKVTLRILNVKTKKFEGDAVVTTVPTSSLGDRGALEEWAQKVYARLTGDKVLVPERVESGPGKLVVKSNVKSGTVFIGAAKKGVLEDGALTLSLPEGEYELAIDAPEHKRYEATVTVTSGKTKTVDAELEAMVGGTMPPPPGGGKSNRTVFKVAGFGLGAVAVGAGAVALYYTVSGPIKDYQNGKGTPVNPDMPEERLAAGSETCSDSAVRNFDDVHNRAFDKACSANSLRTVSMVVGITSGVLAVGALYFAYRGEGSSNERRVDVVGKRKRREFTVTPVISPDGGGATVRFDW